MLSLDSPRIGSERRGTPLFHHQHFPADQLTSRTGYRLPVSLTCEIRWGMGAWRTVQLRNLSPEGFQLGWSPDVRADRPLRIRIPGLQILTAEVRWRSRDAVGCKFLEPLHIAVVEHIAKAQPSYR